MKNNIYIDNVIYLHTYLNSELKSTYQMLKFDTENYIKKFGLNDESIKSYYLTQFNAVKEEVLNIDIDDFKPVNLFNLKFENGIPQINLEEFLYFSMQFLKIPDDYNIEKKEKEQHTENIKITSKEIVFKKMAEQYFDLYNSTELKNAYLNFKLSIKLNYFKHLLNERKEVETTEMFKKKKKTSQFTLYQRYLALEHLFNLCDISLGEIYNKEKSNKYLALILDCDYDSARHLNDNNYASKLVNWPKNEKDIKKYIKEFLQIDKTK